MGMEERVRLTMVGAKAHSRMWGSCKHQSALPGARKKSGSTRVGRCCWLKLSASDIFKTYLWDRQPYSMEVLVTP